MKEKRNIPGSSLKKMAGAAVGVVFPHLVFCLGISDGSAASVALGDTMLLGDSITQAAVGHQGYRYPLWQKLVDGGHSCDFVGSHYHNFNSGNTNDTWSLSNYPDYSGQVFDSDHEGHWGWKTTDVLGTTTPTRTPGTGVGQLSDWLGGYTPDTAFILLGVNDIRRSTGATVAATAANTITIIGAIKADNPSVSIFLGSVLPAISSFVDPAMVNQLNIEYQGIAAADPAITYVDIHSSIDVAEHLYDGVHPNAAGEEILASRFFEAATVPEPSFFALLGPGVLAVLLRRRRHIGTDS